MRCRGSPRAAAWRRSCASHAVNATGAARTTVDPAKRSWSAANARRRAARCLPRRTWASALRGRGSRARRDPARAITGQGARLGERRVRVTGIICRGASVATNFGSCAAPNRLRRSVFAAKFWGAGGVEPHFSRRDHFDSFSRRRLVGLATKMAAARETAPESAHLIRHRTRAAASSVPCATGQPVCAAPAAASPAQTIVLPTRALRSDLQP